ncbi:unnamed protein product [Rotaria socialis]|uniref:Uncharacterized protein n=1 Tax=Rotaria socialis TaxID=392032 RepID=A0A820HW73_9BILA|nr:unnamed protein product [Rotaria socialis]CAF4299464.1 unnamed protein product [Rotaria socialis]
MQDSMEMDDPENIDPEEYVRLREEYEEQLDYFMLKYLRRAWPALIVCILGIFQLCISLIILGVDLPIVLMFAPRWQVFVACWTSLFTFIASVSTIHSVRKTTWLKLKWTVALNIIGGLAAALMIAFDVLYLTNSKVCLVSGGCKYLSYTYSGARSFYVGEVVVGIFFFISVFIFLVIFIKYGIGGLTLFEHIQRGWIPPVFNPIVPSNAGGSLISMGSNPVTGPGVMVGKPSTPTNMSRNSASRSAMMMRGPPANPGAVPRYPPPPLGATHGYPPPGATHGYPPPGATHGYPPPGATHGYPPQPGRMMPRYSGQMMMPRYSGQMMMPGERPPMPGPYRPPLQFPPGVRPVQR